MKQLMVPVDFSQNAFHAARFSCKIAEQINAVIHLIYVLELGHEKVYQPFTMHEKYNNLVLDERVEALYRFRNDLKEQYPLLQIKSQLLSGEVESALFKYAKEEAIDFIVIGNTGAGMAARVLFGSLAETIIKSSPVPVITVPAKADNLIPDRIVFATNHFEKDEKVLSPLIQVATFFKATVHIIYFLNKDEDSVPNYMDNAIKLEHYMHYLKTHFSDISFVAKIIEGDNIVDALEQYEKDASANMLALYLMQKGF